MSIAKARILRGQLTDAERALWRRLRRRQLHGHKFRRQHPRGSYILDFVCLEKKLVVEVDGGQHALQTEHDSIRDEWLQRGGFRVLRFWNTQVLKEMDAVLEEISRALEAL